MLWEYRIVGIYVGRQVSQVVKSHVSTGAAFSKASARERSPTEQYL